MDDLQDRLTRLGLEVIGSRSFVLGGGHAVELNGMSTRPSEDIDLFSSERGSPDAVADDLRGAYEGEGFTVTVPLRTPDFVQLDVEDGSGCVSSSDLAPLVVVNLGSRVPGAG